MNVSPHRQSIAVFGIIVPLFVIVLIMIVTVIGHSSLNDNFDIKVAAFERYETAQTQVSELESFLTTDNRREKIAFWNSKLEQDLVQSLTLNLDKMLAKHDTETLHQTEMGQAPGAGAIGSKTNIPHSRMQLSFEGSFKPMQLLLAELEREMPHLVLESISIRSQPAKSETEKGNLQFGIVYLCWEKPKA